MRSSKSILPCRPPEVKRRDTTVSTSYDLRPVLGSASESGFLDQRDTSSQCPTKLDTPELLLDDEFSLLTELVA